jgi:hypothetical protein
MQAVDESGDHLLPTIQPSDPSDPGENGAPFPESWFETVYKAITFKMTTYRSGSLEMIITLAEPRAAEYYEKFVQQLGDMPGVKVVSEGWSGRESKQTRDQPKIGAPKLSELDDGDPRVEVLKNELRQYLRYRLAKHPKSQDEAAQLVGKGRTTLERYRETWPEIEVEIKKEIEASLAQKVRKV